MLLSSSVKPGNELLAVDLTNADVQENGELILPRHSLHVFRSKFLHDATCYERFRVRNHATRPLRVTLHLLFETDFVDVFEVRGGASTTEGSDT